MKEKTLKEITSLSNIADLQLQKNIISIVEYARIIIHINNRLREFDLRSGSNKYLIPILTQPIENINVIKLIDAIVFSN